MQLSMAVKIELNAQTRAGLAEAGAEAGNEDEHEDGCVGVCVSEQQENLMPLRPEMTTAARSGSGASAA